MTILDTRKKIAQAANFGKYPTLVLDMADTDGHSLVGCKVRIDAGTFDTGERNLIQAELRVFFDDRKLTTCAYGDCLSSTFTYLDYKTMAQYATAPIIGPDQDVLIMIYDSASMRAMAPVLVHTSKSVDRFGATPLSFEDSDFSQYLLAAGH